MIDYEFDLPIKIVWFVVVESFVVGINCTKARFGEIKPGGFTINGINILRNGQLEILEILLKGLLLILFIWVISHDRRGRSND